MFSGKGFSSGFKGKGKGKSWVAKTDNWTGSQSWADDWSSSQFSGGKGKQGGLTSAVFGLSDMMWHRECKEWEKDTRAEWATYEKEEGEKREKEAAERKKERDEFQAQMREDHKKLVDKLSKCSSAGEEEVSKKKRNRGKAPPVVDVEDDADSESDYKSSLRAKSTKKKQRVVSPIEADDWKGWEATNAEAKSALALFKMTALKPKSITGKGILDIAESLDDEGKVGSREELQKRYKKDVGKAAPGRWSRVDLLVGLLANELDSDDDE